MALSVTAAVDAPTASVRLTITGGTPPYVVDAAPGGDRPDYRIRSTYSTVSGSPSTRLAVDGDVPLNTDVLYVATDATGAQAQSATVRVNHAGAVLSDATDPGRALDVVVVSQPPNSWEARSVWWDVLGASAPFASIAPMRFRSGDLVIREADRTARAALLDLLRTGNPFVLRASCGDAVDDLVGLPESLTEELVNVDAPSGPRNLRIAYQAISRELGPYAVDPGRTYAAVLAAYATYGAVLYVFPTYDALRVGDPNAGLGPELVVNGGFSGGGSWGTFWTSSGIVWDYTAGTGKVTQGAAGPGSALTDNAGLSGTAVVAGTVYRVAGRARSTRPGVTLTAELVTNTLPGNPDYFQAGAIVTPSEVIPAGPAWSSFSVDVTVPAGDDTGRLYFRADGLTLGDVVEWDDLSIRARV